MTVVEIQGLELQGRHGALDQERESGQRFLFDIRLTVGDEVGRSDRLEDAVDYREVVAAVRELSDGRRFTLLEGLALGIAEELMARFPLQAVSVRVRKPDVRLDVPVKWTAATVELP